MVKSQMKAVYVYNIFMSMEKRHQLKNPFLVKNQWQTIMSSSQIGVGKKIEKNYRFLLLIFLFPFKSQNVEKYIWSILPDNIQEEFDGKSSK